jgi:Holliday junction resolvase RusA-like endonuclease
MDEMLRQMLNNWDQYVQIIRTSYIFSCTPPQAKQSVRFGNRRAFPDKKKVAYVRKLASDFKASYGDVVLRGMVRLTVLFCFPFPQSEAAMAKLGWALTDKHVDVDNLLKPCKDSLKNLVYLDDHQVVEVRARKIRWHHGFIAIRVDEVMPNRSIPIYTAET